MSSQSFALPDSTARSARRSWFPGWTMLGVAAAAQFMSAPGQSYSVAAFKDAMQTGLALSETQYALAYGFATVLSACLLPFVGRLIDRLGARIMLPAIGIGLGVGCVLMSRVESLGGLYLGFGVVRSLGQGALSLVSVWLVGEWFSQRRGIATAIAGLGGGLSVMTIPLLNNWVIVNHGWQSAWLVLAGAAWTILVLPGILLIRDRPEELGLHPDGIDPGQTTTASRRTQAEPPTTESWTVGEALRDLNFWKLLSVPATSGLVGTGLIFHQVRLLGSQGLSATWALGMLTLQALFATCATFPAGWATDRFPNRHLLCIAMAALAAAILLVMSLPALWLAAVYALLLGLHGSILRSTGNVVWINFYGRAHQGAVRGIAWSVMILAAAVGPLPLALSNDQFGSYRPALCAYLFMPIAAAIAVCSARPPLKPDTADQRQG